MKTKVRFFIGWIFLQMYFLLLLVYPALYCSWYIVEPRQSHFPLTILEEKKKKSQTTFYQLWICKQHSTAQKALQDNSLEAFQKHMTACSILIPLVCGIPAFGTLPLMGYFCGSSYRLSQSPRKEWERNFQLSHNITDDLLHCPFSYIPKISPNHYYEVRFKLTLPKTFLNI